MDGAEIKNNAYRRHVVNSQLDELFVELSAILLDGAKGVGKTSTAEQRCRTIRRLDDDRNGPRSPPTPPSQRCEAS